MHGGTGGGTGGAVGDGPTDPWEVNFKQKLYRDELTKQFYLISFLSDNSKPCQSKTFIPVHHYLNRALSKYVRALK